MDPISIVEDTEQTRFCPQTDRRTRWNQLCWSGGYKNISVDVEDGDCETVGTVKQSRYSWLLYIYSGGLVVYLWCLKRAKLSFDFKVKFDLEGHAQSLSKTLMILT